MTDFMSIEQIVNAAKNDIDNHIEKGTFKGYNIVNDDENEENFQTISTTYAQWGRNVEMAELALDEMFEEYLQFN